MVSLLDQEYLYLFRCLIDSLKNKSVLYKAFFRYPCILRICEYIDLNINLFYKLYYTYKYDGYEYGSVVLLLNKVFNLYYFIF